MDNQKSPTSLFTSSQPYKLTNRHTNILPQNHTLSQGLRHSRSEYKHMLNTSKLDIKHNQKCNHLGKQSKALSLALFHFLQHTFIRNYAYRGIAR